MGDTTKFLYCTEDGNLRPRGWILWTRRCELCGSEMEKIKIPMTKITPFYYASLVIAFGAIGMYLLDMEIPYGTTTLIILVVITMVLAFIDYSKAYEVAKRITGNMKKKSEES